MSAEARQYRDDVAALVETHRNSLHSRSFNPAEHARAASDDYHYRDDDGALLYAVVTYQRNEDARLVAQTRMMTRSLKEAMETLNNHELAHMETRQVRVGGIAIAARQATGRTLDSAKWLKITEERFLFDETGMNAAIAADASTYPDGGRVRPDEVRLEPVPRFAPVATGSLNVKGIDLDPDQQSLMETAESDEDLIHFNYQDMEALMHALITARQEIDEPGREADAPGNRGTVAGRDLSDAWQTMTAVRTYAPITAAYASAALDLELGSRGRMEVGAPAWAEGYIDARRRAELIGDHLVFGSDKLPAGIVPDIGQDAGRTRSRERLDNVQDEAADAAMEREQEADRLYREWTPHHEIPIRTDLAPYYRALAAVSTARRLWDRGEGKTEAGQIAKTEVYSLVSKLTQSPGFHEAAERAETDEGVLMQAAWNSEYSGLAEKIALVTMHANQQEAPTASEGGENLQQDTPAQALFERAKAGIAEARRISESNSMTNEGFGLRIIRGSTWDGLEVSIKGLQQADKNGLVDLLGKHVASSNVILEMAMEEPADPEVKSYLRQAEFDLKTGITAEWDRNSPEKQIQIMVSQIEKLADHKRKSIADTSEDSYATRNDLYSDVEMLNWLAYEIGRTNAGGILDLTIQVKDYGYDHEAAASDASCGLEYVPAIEKRRDLYDSHIGQIGPMIERLKAIGVTVKTGLEVIEPDMEETENMDMTEDEEDDVDTGMTL